MPLLDLFWTMLWLFLFFVWIWLVISIFIDIFRSDMSGWSKALWVVFVIFLPLLGVLVYVIVNGDDMAARSVKQAQEADQAQREYIREAAGSAPSTAEELEKLKGLHDQGVLTDEEFAAQKAKVLNG